MKIGFERQNTLIAWPTAIGARSTSIGAPAAMVEASGFICAISGQAAAATPTATTEPLATLRKSRRVGSCEDIVAVVVTINSPPRRPCDPNFEQVRGIRVCEGRKQRKHRRHL